MKVFISAACRKPKLFGATTLIFKTIRTGFPKAEIIVHGHELTITHTHALRAECAAVQAQFYHLPERLCHDQWIEKLITTMNEPFWICDTDMVFHKRVEHWKFSAPLAGRFAPEFFEEWTNCIHRARLLTCLQYIDPIAIRRQMTAWLQQWPNFPGNPICEFVRQHFTPIRAEDEPRPAIYFYDTMAGLYHAIGGQKFSDEQNACFDHLHCGSYVDLCAPHLSAAGNMEMAHAAAYENPTLAKGAWKEQQEYMNHFATKGT